MTLFGPPCKYIHKTQPFPPSSQIIFLINIRIISSSIRNSSFFLKINKKYQKITHRRHHTYFDILAIMEGYPTFVISILFIGGNTALIGDIAGHLGCFIYLKDCVNAIAFVALGTSVPGRTRARGM